MIVFAQSEFDAIFKDATDKRDRIREIYKIVGNESVTGGFGSGATDELTQATFWRVVSFVFLIGAIDWLVYVFSLNSGLNTGAASTDYWSVFRSLPFSLVLLAGFGYSSSIGAKHRQIGLRYRQQALEMSSLDAFLESLPKDIQDIIKQEITPGYFGNLDIGIDQKEEYKSQFEKMFELLGKLGGKSNGS